MRTVSRRLVPLIAAAALAATRAAATPASAGPAWEAALGSSVGFDSNVYLARFGPLAERESVFGTASARIGAKFDSGLALAWTATATDFAEESDEDNIKQTLGAAWARKLKSLSWTAATDFALVDGDDRGVDYGAGVGSAFSTAVPRERRDQWQNKTDLALRHDSVPGFVRAVGKLQYWDMRTAAVSNCNYVDRYDAQGGLDLGRALSATGPEVYLGYRRGYQFQDNDQAPSSAANASNHYDRTVVGIDGAPRKSLKVNAQVGWEKHGHNADYVGSAHEEDLFVDATLTWSPTKADELQLKACQSRTFSTTGKNSFLLTCQKLSWKHRFGERWNASLAGAATEAEYAPFRRDDLDYAATATLGWDVTRNLSCTLTVTQEWGRNNLNGLTRLAEDRREFDRAFASVGLNWKL
jgi:hypothetical protein